ncbi:MAG TPA: hypothetical protein VJT13_14795 [Xanthobacteraceae bacterium]|nr:hypothetical protein [Xanthobacteraceae bacterium]
MTMQTLIGVLLAILGIVLIVVGLAFFIAFRYALRAFDSALSSQVAGYGREQVELAAMKIRNPLVRRLVLKHLVTTGGTIAVSIARGAIESRMRTALYAAIAGVAVVIASFNVAKLMALLN